MEDGGGLSLPHYSTQTQCRHTCPRISDPHLVNHVVALTGRAATKSTCRFGSKSVGMVWPIVGPAFSPLRSQEPHWVNSDIPDAARSDGGWRRAHPPRLAAGIAGKLCQGSRPTAAPPRPASKRTFSPIRLQHPEHAHKPATKPGARRKR